MMEQHTGKIGIREYIAMVILMIGTKLADDLPSILFQKLENAAWFTPIIAGFISIIPIFFLIKVLSQYPKTNLMEILQIILGKPIGYLFVFMLWIMGLAANTFDTAIYTDIIGTMYFTETPTIFIYIVLMAVSAYGAKKGLEQIGSVAASVITYIKVSLFIALILAFSNGNINYIFPIFGPGKWEVVKESSLKVSLYIDFIYLGVIASYVSSTKAFTKGTWISLIIVIIEIPIAMLAYLCLFDYESVKLLNYPFHETIRYISLGFLTNIETFFFPFWLLASFVRFSIYLYISAVMFGWLFKIKNFEYLIPPFATLLVILGMIPETPTFTVADMKAKALSFATPTFFFLPLILWSIMKIRGGNKNEKKEM
ncbi:GerAB/ArcD/ProY family transporter [Pseudoneobacillus rhizosphaerae]|jgi:spore germination protein KB|nr:endospore germination permease [Pseudoneobacillus rhizosphaerae]